MGMREIKFRAWFDNESIEPNKMVYGYEGPTYVEYIGFSQTDQWGVTIMQYTGLKDKNGKDIYEGDIVKGTWWCDYIYVGIIKFGVTSDMDYDYYGWYIEFTEHNGFLICQSIHDINEKFEIIGNIYENPELTPNL